jgi:hypothetical protein
VSSSSTTSFDQPQFARIYGAQLPSSAIGGSSSSSSGSSGPAKKGRPGHQQVVEVSDDDEDEDEEGIYNEDDLYSDDDRGEGDEGDDVAAFALLFLHLPPCFNPPYVCVYR